MLYLNIRTSYNDIISVVLNETPPHFYSKFPLDLSCMFQIFCMQTCNKAHLCVSDLLNCFWQFAVTIKSGRVSCVQGSSTKNFLCQYKMRSLFIKETDEQLQNYLLLCKKLDTLVSIFLLEFSFDIYMS